MLTEYPCSMGDYDRGFSHGALDGLLTIQEGAIM